jgi:hypothetical protein
MLVSYLGHSLSYVLYVQPILVLQIFSTSQLLVLHTGGTVLHCTSSSTDLCLG